MNPLEQMVLGWIALARTAREMLRPALWVPWIVLAAIQTLVLTLLWWFAHPAFSMFMAPLVRAAGGPDALRYPNLFRLLPELFGRADLVVGALFGAVGIGVGTLLFATRFRGGMPSPSRSLAEGMQRALALILASLPFNLLVIALSTGIEWFVADRESGAMVRRAAYVVIVGGSLVLQAMFLFVPAVMMLERRGVLDALAQLPRTWARGFWAALMLGGILLLPLLPLHVLAGRSSTLVERGTPELVGWLMATQIAVATVTAFLLCGAATLVYLSAVAPERDEGAV